MLHLWNSDKDISKPKRDSSKLMEAPTSLDKQISIKTKRRGKLNKSGKTSI